MCAVIGAILVKPTKQDFDMLKRVFLESKIRGMHATGITFIGKDGTLETYKEPVPSDKFSWLNNFDACLAADGNLYLIGHCRYSTSDLKYNQPLYNDTKSIVHNGVLTQELPENWLQLYGYKTETKNDSELILYSAEPLTEFSHMSMSVCELHIDKKLVIYRNGKRPLYLTTVKNGSIITSTIDIAHRAGLQDNVITELPMNLKMTIDNNLSTTFNQLNIEGATDYQYDINQLN